MIEVFPETAPARTSVASSSTTTDSRCSGVSGMDSTVSKILFPVRQLLVDEGRDRCIAELLWIASEFHDRSQPRHRLLAQGCRVELLQDPGVEVGGLACDRFDQGGDGIHRRCLQSLDRRHQGRNRVAFLGKLGKIVA
ncbi:hypothetical protein JMK10_05705 [Rhodovulum sulfidophilum]|uniref:hypothetical protein n=1 Tax=Rhodovulum sulfidophilum TaxID=35806 RepID=UPI001922276A|nr:hypothetical protein [Rhodovulum sulfidophilum]MBL3575225.1 hypothetical protein [Rhodovulum sulfidophilum]MCE8431291.1 hypothetical protein [Rhodovulum sulfidophilum]MCF4116315.1 hypothetical protein [Rhodovulum sulfidophilum]